MNVELRSIIKNFSKSIQRTTFQAIKVDPSSDLQASQIVPLLLRVVLIDKKIVP